MNKYKAEVKSKAELKIFKLIYKAKATLKV